MEPIAKVERVMKEVLCVPQDATLGELYDLLISNGISGAPVVDSRDFLVGVVSITDITSYLADKDRPQPDFSEYARRGRIPPELKGFEKTRVREVMSPRAYTVGRLASVLEVVELMLSEEIHRVIVTHRNHVVGIVTTSDVLELYRDELVRRA